MNVKVIFLCFLFFGIGIKNSNAQQQQKLIDKCACCTEAHQSFDFWIGDWTVYDSNGNILGTNSIKKEYDNCVLWEQWKSAGINHGTSYNYYNTSDKTWNQVWIDNSGYNLTLKGNYIDGKMILKSNLLQGENGDYYNQITWNTNKDGSVLQTWEVFNKDGKKTQELFKGIYKKTLNNTKIK
tara:strand:+ start:233461 stop:234006 length:546 start_codon:yes stop_codon:yes gene_type:complete